MEADVDESVVEIALVESLVDSAEKVLESIIVPTIFSSYAIDYYPDIIGFKN